MTNLEIWMVGIAIIILLIQSTWLFFDARKHGHNYWFWAIWGLIQTPCPTIFYLIFARKKFKRVGKAFMENLKYILIGVAVVGQIIGVILLFINVQLAIMAYVIYGIALIVLTILLIKERLKEKKEDDENDYRDY